MPSVGHDWCVLRAAATLGRSFPPFRSYSITSTTHQSMTACECGGRKWVSCSRILKSAWLTFDDAVRRRLFRSMLPSPEWTVSCCVQTWVEARAKWKFVFQLQTQLMGVRVCHKVVIRPRTHAEPNWNSEMDLCIRGERQRLRVNLNSIWIY